MLYINNFNKDEISAQIKEAFKDITLVKNNEAYVYNCANAFDIETSSFQEGNNHRAIMYEWTLNLNGLIIIGRTWEDFTSVMDTVKEVLGLGFYKKLVIYVHNLKYEMGFIQKKFQWTNIMCTEMRTPIYAETSDGFIFRCSYVLSGYGLEELGNQLVKYKANKKVGQLDYSKLRTPNTELTSEEIEYCEYDTIVVVNYIKEMIEQFGNVARIPNTKTGIVRRYCNKECNKDKSYKDVITSFKISNTKEWEMLNKAASGGFCHGNAFYIGEDIDNVASQDETSAYPYSMVADKYPMSNGIFIDIKDSSEINKYLKSNCCLFEATFKGLRPTVYTESYIPSSKCDVLDNPLIDHGRVVSADKLSIVITDLDYKIIDAMYEWDELHIGTFITYYKDYLPTPIVKSILKLYEDKTTLKGVEGKESEYRNAKEQLNSVSGMCGTSPMKPRYTYIDYKWDKVIPDVDERIDDYNNSKFRFISYNWYVWNTAYARYHLFQAILAMGNDYIYCDTDCVKYKNPDEHEDFFIKYNENVRKKLTKAMEFHNLPMSMCEPKTIKGTTKLLGAFEKEATYKRFKFLGQKRYIVEMDDAIKIDGKSYNFNITVAGLNKKITIPYLSEQYEDVFEAFNDNLNIPAGYTGDNLVEYIDFETKGTVVGIDGTPYNYHETSSVYMEDSGYSFNEAQLYANFIKKLIGEN